jgi:hypothetical protein
MLLEAPTNARFIVGDETTPRSEAARGYLASITGALAQGLVFSAKE